VDLLLARVEGRAQRVVAHADWLIYPSLMSDILPEEPLPKYRIVPEEWRGAT
jgi:hypothetical protein